MKTPHHQRRAFTLVEVLVSVTVLAIISLVIMQIVTSVSSTSRLSNRAMDAASQARLVFAQLDADLKNLTRRDDSVFIAQNPAVIHGADNLLLFLTGVASPETRAAADGGNRGLSMVAYRLDTHADNHNRPCLLRGAVPVGWNDSNFMGVQPNGLPLLVSDTAFNRALLPRRPSDPAPFTAAHDDFQVLAPGVLRMVVGFQLYPDHGGVTLQNGGTVTALGQIVHSPPMRRLTAADSDATAETVDLQRIASLVVALAIIDLDSARLLTAPQLETLAAAFPVPPAVPADGDHPLPVQQWLEVTDGLATLPDSVPLPARQSVRLYQRFYPVTPCGERKD